MSLLEKWCKRYLPRQLSAASVRNIITVGEAFERECETGQRCRLQDIMHEGTGLTYDQLSGDWWRSLSGGLAAWAVQRVGGALELISIRIDLGLWEAHQLVTRDEPRIVVGCVVVREGGSEPSVMGALYHGVRTKLRLTHPHRITILETERLFDPAEHPLRRSPGQLELALRVDSRDWCPPALSDLRTSPDPRTARNPVTGGPAADVFASGGARRPLEVFDPTKPGIQLEVLQRIEVRNEPVFMLSRPRALTIGRQDGTAKQVARAIELGVAVQEAAGLGPVGDRETLDRLILPARGVAAQNLVLVRAAMRAAEAGQ